MTVAQTNAEQLWFRLSARLETLKAELAIGERRMMALEAERSELRDTLLRISGAVEVLEEQLAAPGAERVEAVP